MNVTKVRLLVNQALFGKCYFAGTEFFITSPYLKYVKTVNVSDVFDCEGEAIGEIKGSFSDFGDGKVFQRIENNKDK